jgi:hypothetical protein
MRTTVSIDDPLLENAKRCATERGITLGALFEDALRTYFAAREKKAVRPFRLLTKRGWLVDPTMDLKCTSAIIGAEDDEVFKKLSR